MYLFIYEDGTFWSQHELSEDDRNAFATGYVDIINMDNNTQLGDVLDLSNPDQDEWLPIKVRNPGE